MDNFVFNVKDKVSFTFSLTPGGSQPSPEPVAPQTAFISGAPLLYGIAGIFGGESYLVGTPVLVEEE